MLIGNIKVCEIIILVTFTSGAYSQVLKIYHVDVEQADATLVISPTSETLLIDCGKNGNDGQKVKTILDQEGITHIDHFICTHYHLDHYGGIDELYNEPTITIGHVHDRGDKDYLPTSKITSKAFKDYQKTVGQNAVQFTRGESFFLGSEVQVKCIATGGVVLSEEPPVHGVDENDMSIACVITFGPFKYFNGGDIEKPTEIKIADRDLVKNVDVCKANHHGSTTSSSPEFMNDLAPTAIIISNGNHGGYKHPQQETLDLYTSLTPQPVVLQTNKYLKGGSGGNVCDEYIADLESTNNDGTILIEVNINTNSNDIVYRDKRITLPVKPRELYDYNLVIASLLPNPIGPDNELEEVRIKNKASSPVSVSGCILFDLSYWIWSLEDNNNISPGQSLTIQRNRMPMSLNNSGDIIKLLAPSNKVLDSIAYTGSQEGVQIDTGH